MSCVLESRDKEALRTAMNRARNTNRRVQRIDRTLLRLTHILKLLLVALFAAAGGQIAGAAKEFAPPVVKAVEKALSAHSDKADAAPKRP